MGRKDGGSRVGAGLPNLCAGEEGRRSESALSKGKWDTGLSTEGFLVIEKKTYRAFLALGLNSGSAHKLRNKFSKTPSSV